MIKNLLKGMVIGIANIIPGVSGGTMAVSMGIYDKLIHCLTHLFSEFKENLKFVVPIGIGVVIALAGLPFVITPAFEHFPLQTNALFIGLIVGGLPAVWKKVKGNSVRISHILPFLFFFLLVVGMAALGETEGKAADLSLSVMSVVKLFLVGIIASATMVIPGVSGSMVLLILGYYNPIVATIKEFVEALLSFDMPEILRCCGILIPAGIGIVVGIFAIAKLIEILFEKFPLQAYWAIIGLIAASPIAILLVADLGKISVIGVLTSIVTLLIGFVIAMKLGD
ncbi:MAG: DUF368 domain-containing protein [Lachnospiraceae bacterium]|nr:DUF368 domain-containing protein [Lachnospiraceae bacterium]